MPLPVGGKKTSRSIKNKQAPPPDTITHHRHRPIQHGKLTLEDNVLRHFVETKRVRIRHCVGLAERKNG